MNYELAKMLKDAGFSVIIDDSSYEDPTLSELIEACGDRFGAVYKAHDNITIEGEGDKITCENVYEAVDSTTFRMMTSPKFPKSFLVNSGSTPEEAVANLWLQLNSQDNSTQTIYIDTPDNWKCPVKGCTTEVKHEHTTYSCPLPPSQLK